MGARAMPSIGSLFRFHFFLLLTIVALVLYASALWLPEDALENCEQSWVPCLNIFVQKKEPNFPVTPMTSDSDGDNDNSFHIECAAQKFQVSRLLSHLHSTLGPGSDILLQPYLSSWDELIKFMKAMGPVVGFISRKVEQKVARIRELAEQASPRQVETLERRRSRVDTGVSESDDVPTDGRKQREIGVGGNQEPYRSVRSMIRTELSRDLVNFHAETPSGCRNLLRLHRSLLWLQLFLKKMGDGPDVSGRLASPSDMCREAYHQVLAPHHPWLLRQAAEMAFVAMPDRGTLLKLVCVRDQTEAGPVLDRVVRAIEKVHHRTQMALEEHGMLELP